MCDLGRTHPHPEGDLHVWVQDLPQTHPLAKLGGAEASSDRSADVMTWLSRLLGGLLMFVGVGAAVGGGMLVLDPTGATLGLALEVLNGTPFSDYSVPGIVLLVCNGFGSLMVGFAVLAKLPYAAHAAAAMGLFLVAWIAIQVAMIGLFVDIPFQPVFFGIGLLELGLAGWLIRATKRT